MKPTYYELRFYEKGWWIFKKTYGQWWAVWEGEGWIAYLACQLNDDVNSADILYGSA